MFPGKPRHGRSLDFGMLLILRWRSNSTKFLCGLLSQAGAEVLCLPAPESLTLDAVYAHDASLATDYGLILMNPGKQSRVAEAQAHADFCGQLGIPVFGGIRPPGTVLNPAT